MGASDDQDFKKEDSVALYKRQDVWMFISGCVFIAVLVAFMFGIGTYRQWYAPSGYEHNISFTSPQRFLPEPSEYDPYANYHGRSDASVGDCRARWYYWKLKPWDITALTRLFVWLGYIGHQLSIWFVIYLAQLEKSGSLGGKYSTNLNKYNYICFGLNVFFHILHFIQTHTTYDALAQDVVITSSQGSVIMLLVLVMLLQYTERGLFFGWPTLMHTGKISVALRLKHSPINLLRKFHGYGFAWAAIYTFWYHPMENTYGHAFGFVYTWMFMLQGSLMFTNFHKTRWWRLLQEFFVAIHGAGVAIQTGGPSLQGTSLWPMFLFGFLWLFVLTQVFILDFWNKIPYWTRCFPVIICLGVTLGNYAWIPDANGQTFVRIQEIIRIPAIYYLCVIYTWAIVLFFEWVSSKIHGGDNRRLRQPLSKLKQGIYIMGFLFIYSLLVGISIFFQKASVPIMMFVSMVLLIFVFITGVCVAMMFVKEIVPSGPIKATAEKEMHSTACVHGEGSNESIKKTQISGLVIGADLSKVEDDGCDNDAFNREKTHTSHGSQECDENKKLPEKDLTEIQIA